MSFQWGFLMKKSSIIGMSVLATACLAAVAAEATSTIQILQPIDPPPVADQNAEPVDETPQRWFVELRSTPTADGGQAATLASEQNAFRAAARNANIRYIENYAYSGLFNGFSVTVSRAQLSTLASLPGVKAIYPVETIPMPKDPVSVPEMFSALGMTGADIAQSSLGLDGTGIRVAVMDTGIDIDHPDFGGSGTNGTTSFPTSRIIKGWDFVGDAFNADASSPAYNPVPTPDPVPDDCGGHGTHVAGIIGGNGRIKGVAPNVRFGAYRVFGCQGSTTGDVMIAAMERAWRDGMQVLNMSIGSSFQWPEYPTAQAASRLVDRGVVVVAAAGNSGSSGIYASGAPGVGEKVISVASFDNLQSTSPAFTITPDDRKIGYAPASGVPAPPVSGTGLLAATGTTTSTSDACSALPAGSLSGKIALIRRGSCSFYIKAMNAQMAGAVGVVIYNNVPGIVNANASGAPAVTIPVVGITDVDGVAIAGRLSSGAVTMTWGSSASVPNPTAGLVSSFSSYGISPDLQIKPDIGAPGGTIYSTYPLELGGYANLSGTSMASPHVAGAAALLLQANPGMKASAVRSALQNTAVPAVWSGNPGLGYLDIVHRQGAGMLHIDQAILATTRVEPGKLSLGEGEKGPISRTVSVTNNGSRPVTYTMSAINSVSTFGSSYAQGFYLPSTTVGFPIPTITVKPGKTVPVPVTFYPGADSGASGALYGGYIVLTPNDGSAVLRVPFAGYEGDYQAKQVMTPTGNGFPWLAKLSGGSYIKQPAGATYTMVGNDVPFFLIHFDHQARKLQLEIYDADNGRYWLSAMRDEFIPRNSTATGFFAFTWDGKGRNTSDAELIVPNGRYVIKARVLKPLGDESNPAHWETWTSPVITIAR